MLHSRVNQQDIFRARRKITKKLIQDSWDTRSLRNDRWCLTNLLRSLTTTKLLEVCSDLFGEVEEPRM